MDKKETVDNYNINYNDVCCNGDPDCCCDCDCNKTCRW